MSFGACTITVFRIVLRTASCDKYLQQGRNGFYLLGGGRLGTRTEEPLVEVQYEAALVGRCLALLNGRLHNLINRL